MIFSEAIAFVMSYMRSFSFCLFFEELLEDLLMRP